MGSDAEEQEEKSNVEFSFHDRGLRIGCEPTEANTLIEQLIGTFSAANY